MNPWRKPTKDDEWLINKMLITVHQQFKSTLIECRKVSTERAQILADGRIYAGEDALAEQLVDELGGIYDAIQYAGKLVNLDDPKVIYPNRGLKDWVQSLRASSFGALNSALSGQIWMR